MKILLPDFSTARVLVVGDIMLDRYWYGVTDRISPEAPVPVVKVNEQEDRPGAAANVAMNIAALQQSHVRLVGLIGIDEPARILANQLTQHHVDCHLIPVTSHPTITKLRVISRNQQLIRADFEEGFYDIDHSDLLHQIECLLPKVNILILSDYGKGVLAHVETIIALARQYGVPVLIDPKGTDFSRYRHATLLTPNLSEFEAVVGHCSSSDEIEEKGRQLLQSLELEALLITRSEQGMTLLQDGKPALHMPTQAQEVFDVTGAGDTVIALLGAALSTGKTVEESCFLANAAAGIVVGKVGTSTVSFVELEDAIRGRADNGFGIMDSASLQIEVAKARQRGETIVMTNGCFDILHSGHVSYLANARRLGDRLIVAVNSDQSVKRLKGESRPINPLSQRMILLGALESVDWVIDFNDDTPQQLIADILPDVLVKGGDYRPEDIAGGSEVLAAGGEVKVLNFEAGVSTSAIIRAIQSTSKS